MARRGGRASQRLTQLVIETYGPVCWLQLPGCKHVATTKDHVVPYSHGGTDDLENLRPACKSCNSKRQDRVLTGYGASVVIVCGPPAAGKSTYVLDHAQPSDVVIDMDRIARALMPFDPIASHEYPEHIRHVTMSARKAAINRATRLREHVTVWLIHALPKPEDMAEYRAFGWQVVTIDPGPDVVRARIETMRPAMMQGIADRWYNEHAPQYIEVPMRGDATDAVDAIRSYAAAVGEPDW